MTRRRKQNQDGELHLHSNMPERCIEVITNLMQERPELHGMTAIGPVLVEGVISSV